MYVFSPVNLELVTNRTVFGCLLTDADRCHCVAPVSMCVCVCVFSFETYCSPVAWFDWVPVGCASMPVAQVLPSPSHHEQRGTGRPTAPESVERLPPTLPCAPGGQLQFYRGLSGRRLQKMPLPKRFHRHGLRHSFEVSHGAGRQGLWSRPEPLVPPFSWCKKIRASFRSVEILFVFNPAVLHFAAAVTASLRFCFACILTTTGVFWAWNLPAWSRPPISSYPRRGELT